MPISPSYRTIVMAAAAVSSSAGLVYPFYRSRNPKLEKVSVKAQEILLSCQLEHNLLSKNSPSKEFSEKTPSERKLSESRHLGPGHYGTDSLIGRLIIDILESREEKKKSQPTPKA